MRCSQQKLDTVQPNEGVKKAYFLALLLLLRKKSVSTEQITEIVTKFVAGQAAATDFALKRVFKKAGYLITFENPVPTAAFILENTKLVRNWLEAAGVMVSTKFTEPKPTEVTEVKFTEPKPTVSNLENRAALISKDQGNKINSFVNKTRQLELGIAQAVWVYEHFAKYPRYDHIDAEGTVYNVSQGCFISGQYIQPGELINCGCSSRIVLPAGNQLKQFDIRQKL